MSGKTRLVQTVQNGDTPAMSPFRRRKQGNARAEIAAAPAGPPIRRLLVCDDNDSVTHLLELLFSHEDWALEVVTNGPDCLAALDRSRPDVLLLDQRLDGPLSGIETATAARQRGYDLPILLFSAYLDDEARGDAERLQLIAVSKLDFPAIVRHVNAAYQLAQAKSGP
ncbi:MAG: hypothetical protein QOJ79_2416 [Actinomycetota bacterium]|nr:hypothetical protein [Actinomycetota bacterium]